MIPSAHGLDLTKVRGLQFDGDLVQDSWYVADSFSPRIVAGPFDTVEQAEAERRQLNIADDCNLVLHTGPDRYVPTPEAAYKLDDYTATGGNVWISADGSPWQLQVNEGYLGLILGDMGYHDILTSDVVGQTDEHIRETAKAFAETGPEAEENIFQILLAGRRLLGDQERLSSAAFSYALAAQQGLKKAWADGAAPDTFSQVKVLHRGCANEAAYWTFETSEGETYTVEVQRRSVRSSS